MTSVGMKLTKSGHFSTTYLPRLVNVVCERPLNQNSDFFAHGDRATLSHQFEQRQKTLIEPTFQ